LVVTISEPGKIRDGMVSLTAYDGKYFLGGSERHKRYLYTYRYCERKISAK
jgi:hypothetical protein